MSVVKKENHDAKDFALSISLPPATMLRHHAIKIALNCAQAARPSDQLFKPETATVKEAWRVLYTSRLESLLGLTHSRESEFSVNIVFSFKDNERECRCVCDAKSSKNRWRKNVTSQFNISNVKNALGKMDDDDFQQCDRTFRDLRYNIFLSFHDKNLFHFIFRCYQCPPTTPKQACCFSVECSREPVFLAGRYNKYSRY